MMGIKCVRLRQLFHIILSGFYIDFVFYDELLELVHLFDVFFLYRISTLTTRSNINPVDVTILFGEDCIRHVPLPQQTQFNN